MADEGINWGGVVLGLGGGLAALVALPVVLTGGGELLAQNAADSSTTLQSIASGAQTASDWIAGQLSSVFGAIGTNVKYTALQSMDGVWGALSTTGQQAFNLANNNLPATAAVVGTTALAGAAIGQWTNKNPAKSSGPGGGSYAEMARARQMAMARATGRAT